MSNAGLHALVADLVHSGRISDVDLERARRASAASETRLDRTFRDLGLVDDRGLVEAWSRVTGLAIATASEIRRIPVAGIPDSFFHHTRSVPLALDEHAVVLGLEDPLDDYGPRAVALKLGLEVTVRLLENGTADRLYAAADAGSFAGTDLGEDTSAEDDVERLRDLASDAPVVKLVNSILESAIEERASDIHILCLPGGASRVRFRIDGILTDQNALPLNAVPTVVSRLKIMAGLDIAERRLPQDGRIRASVRGRDVDLRLASMPHVHGEGVVLRILDRSTSAPDLDTLGFDAEVQKALRRALQSPNGLVLVTGPTGSGKTTTLYAALKSLIRPDRNVITVEDPVEVHLPGVAQVPLARRIGFDFAAALKAVLRQDPDVVLVGEIRDRETAEVAVQAAMTGHLVLASLHTNTAAGALPRLVDLGVDANLVALTVRCCLSQRLVRRICATCNGAVGVPACETCGGSGYRGRLAIAECLEVTPEVARVLAAGADEEAIRAVSGGTSLRACAEEKIAAGLTTRAEVIRVLGGGDP